MALAVAASVVPVLPLLFRLRARSGEPLRCGARRLADPEAALLLPSLSRWRPRSRTLTDHAMGDMEKRLVIFLVASVAIVYLFTLFGHPPPLPTVVPQQATAPAVPGSAPTPAAPPPVGPGEAPAQATAPPQPASTVTIDTPLYRATISTAGGGLTDWELKRYTETINGSDPVVLYPPEGRPPVSAPLSVEIPGIDATLLNEALYHLEGSDARLDKDHPSARVRLTASLPLKDGSGRTVTVDKEFLFHSDTYRVDLTFKVNGLNGPYRVTLGDSFGLHVGQGPLQRFIGHRGAVSLIGDKLVMDKPDKLDTSTVVHTGDVHWTAIEGKYFVAALIPTMPVGEATVARADTTGISAALALQPGRREEMVLYAGPKEYKALTALHAGLEQTIDFGWFMFGSLTLVRFIAKPLFLLLQFLYDFTHNYGIAIILLTALIKLCFVPLTHKSYTSMKAMQALQPKMAELQKKFKDDKERFNKELFQLYKTHKVNPLGGCLPMILQIPVFVAFYNILYSTIELRHAPFFWWIHDLSDKDPYYVLPLVMGATMFIQQKIQPSAMDPKQARMMLFMPVIFTFMFLQFPSGLVLYWLVNNLLTIVQQYVTMSRYPAPAPST
jgi:YidC/Oxa1 family membrane protein insertase